MTDAELRRFVIDWLDDEFHFGDAEQLIGDDDASLLTRGVLDSLGFLRLVLHVEKTFGVTIDRGALTRDNFDTLNKILAYLRKLPGFPTP